MVGEPVKSRVGKRVLRSKGANVLKINPLEYRNLRASASVYK